MATAASESCSFCGDVYVPPAVVEAATTRHVLARRLLSIIPPNSDTAIATNGDGLLNENADATDAAHTANKNRIEIGRITDDKDPNGDAIYALHEKRPDHG